MKKLNLIIGIIFVLLICGCSSDEEVEASGSAKTKAAVSQNDRSKYLAYEYRISVDLPEEKIEKKYNEIIQSCLKDNKHNCTILSSSLNTGNYNSSDIAIRIKPEGISNFLNLASSDGKVTRQSTEVEDLESSIVDNEKRLDMLKSYRTKLEEIELKSSNDIDSLIKITQELSSVQSQIESAEGNKASLAQRIDMNILRISLFSKSYVSFWQPIYDALSEFSENLSDGVSGVIIALAYLLPWSVLLIIIGFSIRFIYKKFRRKS